MTKVDNIINAYANDLDVLTREECTGEDFSEKQCEVLEIALGTGAGGIITPEEKTALEQAGFAKDFIQELAGTDGKKALQSRVRWLGDHIDTKWYRPDADLDARRVMVMELGAIGPDAKEAVPALISVLKEIDLSIQVYAETTLGRIGPDAKDSVPALIGQLKKPDSVDRKGWAVRSSAARALGQIGPDAKEAVSALIESLNDQDEFTRRTAAEALANIGKKAFFAIPVLQEMAVSDRDIRCRWAAQEALDKMMGEIR